MKRQAASLEEAAIYAALTGFRFGEKGEPVAHPTSVYRVEMEDGRGPFNTERDDRPEIFHTLVQPNEGWPGRLLKIPKFKTERMGVTEAMFYAVHGGAAYACESLAAINTWFPLPSRQYLATLGGAKIVQYCIPKGQPILKLDLAGECVFNPVTAHRVATLPIDTEINDVTPL